MKTLITYFLLIFTTCAYAASYSSDNPYQIHAVITSETVAKISSPMAGYIETLNVKDGSQFKKGETLLKFDCQVEQAELQKAKAEIKLAKINQSSYSRLARLGSASKVKVAESQAQYEKAIAEEKIASKKVKDCTIIAPFNGQVTELFARQHETMKLHQELFTILANNSIVVKVLVPSDWLSWLTIGTPFKIHIRETNKTYQAVVDRIVNSVDAISRSVKIIGHIEGNYTNLKSGMSGQATFQGNKKQ